MTAAHSCFSMLRNSQLMYEVTALTGMQASRRTEPPDPPHARLHMQAKLSPPTLLQLMWCSTLEVNAACQHHTTCCTARAGTVLVHDAASAQQHCMMQHVGVTVTACRTPQHATNLIMNNMAPNCPVLPVTSACCCCISPAAQRCAAYRSQSRILRLPRADSACHTPQHAAAAAVPSCAWSNLRHAGPYSMNKHSKAQYTLRAYTQSIRTT
jgi:hypothetical protein